MKTVKRLLLGLLANSLLLLTSCGFVASDGTGGGYPDDTYSYSTQVVNATTNSELGLFIKSERNTETKEWFTEAEKGVFITYTSAKFAPKEYLMLKSVYTNGVLKERKLVGFGETKLIVEVKL